MTSNRAIHTSGTRQHLDAAPAICNVAESRGVHRGREGGGRRDQNEWGLIYLLLFFRRDVVSCRVEKEPPSLSCIAQS